jgi:Ca2+-binding EF-hand superfamily protein
MQIASTKSPAVSGKARSSKRPSVPPAKVQRYVSRIIDTHDANGDGQLQREEWGSMHGDPLQIDANRDDVITGEEYVRYVHRYGARRSIHLVSPEPPPQEPDPQLLQPTSVAAKGGRKKKPAAVNGPPGDDQAAENANATASRTRKIQRRRDSKFFVPSERLPSELPSWFHTQDRNGDGQITMAEYAPELSASTVAIFRRYDRNGDGIITSDEYMRITNPGKKKSTSPPAASSRSSTANRTTKSTGETATKSTSQTEASGSAAVSLEQLDKDSDGRIAKTELPSALQRYFSRYDRDDDGYLSATEAAPLRSRLAKIR